MTQNLSHHWKLNSPIIEIVYLLQEVEKNLCKMEKMVQSNIKQTTRKSTEKWLYTLDVFSGRSLKFSTLTGTLSQSLLLPGFHIWHKLSLQQNNTVRRGTVSQRYP